MSRSATDADVFDEPSRWRARAALRLGLRGEARMAAASTGAALPLALGPLERSLDVGRGDLVVDVGAGLAGVSAWLAHRTGARVVAVEPAIGSVEAAAALFGDRVTVVAGNAAALPMADRTVRAVTFVGVLSLVDDLHPVLAEAVRVLAPGGRIGLSDLVLADGVVERPAGTPNTFRSLSTIAETLRDAGFDVVDAAYGDAAVRTAWSDLGREVDDEVAGRHGDDPRYAIWRADQDAIGKIIADGLVDVGCLVAAPAGRFRGDDGVR